MCYLTEGSGTLDFLNMVLVLLLNINHNTTICFAYSSVVQAYNLSTDHKPDLEEEKERILGAGGFIVAGRVNASVNLSRAIGIYSSSGGNCCVVTHSLIYLFSSR